MTRLDAAAPAAESGIPIEHWSIKQRFLVGAREGKHNAVTRYVSALAVASLIIAVTAVPLTAGTRLGPYEVTAQIGAGGMGEVYRATDTNLKRQVAIKVLPEAVPQTRIGWRGSSARPKSSRR